MNFDILRLKTWSNRRDVRVGDVGYVTCDFNTFYVRKEASVTKATIKDIDDNDSRCFITQPLDGMMQFQYSFFLPLNAVKEDKPKEYRPFRTVEEVSVNGYEQIVNCLEKNGIKVYKYLGE